MSIPLVDVKCVELAEHFLSGFGGDPTDAQKMELARLFQDAADDWFEHGHECDYVDSVEGPNVVGKHCWICENPKDDSDE